VDEEGDQQADRAGAEIAKPLLFVDINVENKRDEPADGKVDDAVHQVDRDIVEPVLAVLEARASQRIPEPLAADHREIIAGDDP
jgi:hypothetical protein